MENTTMSNYKRSLWAEEAGVWHDLKGFPWKQLDHAEHGWGYWDDHQREYMRRDGLPEHVLLDALVEIIGQLKDELEELKQ